MFINNFFAGKRINLLGLRNELLKSMIVLGIKNDFTLSKISKWLNNMRDKLADTTKNLFPYIIPTIIGVFALYCVTGLNIVNPQNIIWLQNGDPATHYLGWQFFRHSDWEMPLGLNPTYGGPISNSIVFSDSNALLAIFFKSISGLLPEPFQYFGLWILGCFILQAIMAWKIIGIFTQNLLLRALGAGFFVVSPPMIWRLHGHLNLFAHFIVLSALYLVIRRPKRHDQTYWIILLCLSILVHAYFTAAVLAFWALSVMRTFISGETTIRNQLIHVVSAVLFSLTTAWLAGYFTVKSGALSGGFGVYRFNLLSFFDSEGWSYFPIDIANPPVQIEGFAYLGLGFLLLLPIFIYQRFWLKNKKIGLRLDVWLWMTLGAFLLFAISNNIGIGNFSFRFPILDFLKIPGSVFRASGRMIWPVYYFVLLGVLGIIIVYCKRSVAISLLCVALVVQVIDTSAGWRPIHATLSVRSSDRWATELTSDFWSQAANIYQNIYTYPTENIGENWKKIAQFAGKNRLTTNAVYLARVDPNLGEIQESEFLSNIDKGQFNSDTLYIFSEEIFNSLVGTSMSSDSHLLSEIDGLFVFAPNWAKHSKFRGQEVSQNSSIALNVGDLIHFNTVDTNQKYLSLGWSAAEPNGTWSQEKKAHIFLQISSKARFLILDMLPFITSDHPHQVVRVSVNGVFDGEYKLTSTSAKHLEIDLENYLPTNVNDDYSSIRIELSLPDAISAVELGMNADTRKLGIALLSLSVY